jgi:putative selenium metabolism hydrolase
MVMGNFAKPGKGLCDMRASKEFIFWNDLINFCQRLIQTPSLSGEEEIVAQLIKEEMKRLRYDDVWTDQVGNVIGLLKGDRDKPSICFTGHMDTVPLGVESGWEYPPYSGTIAEGYLHGRGACDMKGPLATQVYIPAILRGSNVKHGDIYVIEVIQEEQGGLGSKYLDENIKKRIDYAINGEPTSTMINTGQRGRAQLAVTFKGKSAHSSSPWLGKNPFYDMANFLLKLDSLEMVSYEKQKSTVVPTLCKTDTENSNIIPGECRLILVWSDVPGESENKIIEKIRSILPENGEVEVEKYDLKTYTGLTLPIKRRKLPFSIENNHPLVKVTVEAVRSILNKEVEIRWWDGATDCGFFMEAGIPIIGFSPAEMEYAHTDKERISLELIKEAMKCYPAIIASISKLEKRRHLSDIGEDE